MRLPLLAFSILLVSTMATVAQTTAKYWFDKGIVTKNDSLKIRYYSEAIKLNPKYTEAYNNRGEAKSNLSKYQEAIADYDQAIKLNPKYTLAYYNRANVKSRSSFTQEGGIADYDQAIKLNPKDAKLYLSRGRAKYYYFDLFSVLEKGGSKKLKREKEAIADYDQAIKLNPKYSFAYNSRAHAKYSSSQYQEAIADFDQAIKFNPKDDDSYYYRGNAKSNLGRHQEAIADFSQLIKLIPNRDYPYKYRGEARCKVGLYQEAIADYDQVILIDPKAFVTYLDRGEVKYKLDRYWEAIADYDQAIQIYPDYSRAYLDKGQALVKLGHHAQAMDSFRQGEVLDSSFTFHLEDKKFAQLALEKRSPTVVPASAPRGKRYALLIGNSAYQHGSTLAGRPVNDATDMATRLQQLGFTVTLKPDADKKTMERMLREFNAQIQGAEVALFFYAGHGVEVDGVNYLLPTDAELNRPDDADTEALNVQTFLDKLKNSGATFSVAVLDACRKNPFKNWTGNSRDDTDRGFKTISNLSGRGNMYLAMATGWNSVAQNGSGRNGVYTQSLLNFLQPGEELESIFQNVSVEVKEQTNRQQNPQLLIDYAIKRKLTF